MQTIAKLLGRATSATPRVLERVAYGQYRCMSYLAAGPATSADSIAR